MKYLLATSLLAAAVSASAQSEKAPKMPDPGESFMLQFDRDKNGLVTLDEFKAPQVKAIEQQFKHMDKNADGNVERAEVDAFAQDMRQRMEQMQEQQGGTYRR